MHSGKYFLLGVLSDSFSISITSKIGDKRDKLSNKHDLELLRSLERVLAQFSPDEAKEASQMCTIDGSNEVLVHEAIRLGVEPTSFGVQIPFAKSNWLFQSRKIFA